MSYLGRKWGFAIESSGAGEVLDAPTAEFNIEVNPDVDETGAPLEAVDAEGNPTIDVVQTEIVEDQAEIEETADQVEKLEDTAEVLEHYAAAIEHRIRTNGGLTAGEYEFLMIGLESRVKNAGELMPSVESVGRGRLAASREALDSIKEGIRKVWETIKRAIQSLYRKVKGWFVKTFDGAEMLRKRAEGVQKRNDKINGGVDDKSPIELGKGDGAKLMDKDGKPCFNGTVLISGLNSLNSLATLYIKRYTEDMDDVVDASAKMIQSMVDQAKDVVKNHDASTSEFSVFKFDVSNTTAKANYNTSNQFSGKVPAEHHSDTELKYGSINENNLFGGKTIVAVTGLKKGDPSSLEDWKKLCAKQRVQLKPFYLKHKEFNDGGSKVLTLKEISSACDVIIEICGIITDYRKQWYNRERLIDRVQKDIDSAVREVESDLNDAKVNGVVSKVITAIKSVGTRMTNEINDQVAIISYLLSTCKAALVYCTRSQSRYKNN